MGPLEFRRDLLLLLASALPLDARNGGGASRARVARALSGNMLREGSHAPRRRRRPFGLDATGQPGRVGCVRVCRGSPTLSGWSGAACRFTNQSPLQSCSLDGLRCWCQVSCVPGCALAHRQGGVSHEAGFVNFGLSTMCPRELARLRANRRGRLQSSARVWVSVALKSFPQKLGNSLGRCFFGENSARIRNRAPYKSLKPPGPQQGFWFQALRSMSP